GMPFAPGGKPGWPDVGIALAAAGVWFVVNNVLVTTAVALRFGGSWFHALRENLAGDALTTGSLLLLGPVLVGATRASAALIPLVIVPLLAVNRMARLASEQNQAVRTDPLTRLASRKALQSEVGHHIAASTRRMSVDDHERGFALMILDIDRFKHVNDALGHAAGDRLLVEISQRIDRAVPEGNLVARLGGDEFAIVAPEIDNIEEARASASASATGLANPAPLDRI